MDSAKPVVGDRVSAAEQVVAAALRAFETLDWGALVVLTDSSSVLALKATYLATKRWQFEQHVLADAMMAREMTPEAVDESKRIGKLITNPRKFGELAGIHSFEQAEALDAPEFLIRWAQARHGKYLVDGISPWNHEREPESRVVVGSLAIRPDAAAVMVRSTSTFHISSVMTHEVLGGYEFIPVICDPDGKWGIDATPSWLGLVSGYV